MIVEAFLEWAMQAGARERIRAAAAIGRAFLKSRVTPWERAAAGRALQALAADRSPAVRQSLAYAIADSPQAPHDVILTLAADEPDIAAVVILRSPILTDIDLIDILATRPLVARALVAARPKLSDVVAATIAETGSESELTILLENTDAAISSVALRRIAERMRQDENIRTLLAARPDLDMETRAGLILGDRWSTTEVPATLDRAIETMNETESEWKLFAPQTAAARSEAAPAAAGDLAGAILENRNLAPALLLDAICRLRVEEAAAAISALSGMSATGVMAILQRGRFPTVRALFESAGLGRATSTLLVEAALLWREAVDVPEGDAVTDIAAALREKLARAGAPAGAVDDLLSLAGTVVAPGSTQTATRKAA